MDDEHDSEFEVFIKHLDYFVKEVLHSAQNDGSWTINCVHRGLGWALYCEEAVKQTNISCALSSYLDTQPFTWNVTIEDVKTLRKCLLGNLFLNQLLPKETSECLVDIAKKEIGDLETHQLIETSLQKVNGYQTLVQEMRQKPFERIFNVFKVRLLIEATTNSSCGTLSSLDQLFNTRGSLYQLLMLTNQLPKNENDQLSVALGGWLSEKLSKDPLDCIFLFQEIASLPEEQLTLLCQKYPGLQMKLLSLVKVFGTEVCNSMKDPKSSDKRDHHNSLVTLCRTFLSVPDLASATASAFSSWCVTDEAHFWHKLFIEIQK